MPDCIYCQIIKLLIFFYTPFRCSHQKNLFLFFSLRTLEAILGFSVLLKDTPTYRQEELGIKPPTLMINGRSRPTPNEVCAWKLQYG